MIDDYDRRWLPPHRPLSAPDPRPFDEKHVRQMAKRATAAVAPGASAIGLDVPHVLGVDEGDGWFRELFDARNASHGGTHELRSFTDRNDRRFEIADLLVTLASHGPVDILTSATRAILGVDGLLDCILDERDRVVRHESHAYDIARSEAFDARLATQRSTVAVFTTEALRDAFAQTMRDRERAAEAAIVVPVAPSVTGSLLFAARNAFTAGIPGRELGYAEYDAIVWKLAVGFANRVAPYLDDRERTRVADRARAALERTADGLGDLERRRSPWHGGWPDPCLALLSAVHDRTTVRRAAQAYRHRSEGPFREDVQVIAFGCGDVELARDLIVSQHVTFTPRDVRDWLAFAGESEYECAVRRMRLRGDGSDVADFVAAFGMYESTAAARTVLALTTRPAFYIAARTWLEGHPAVVEPVVRASRGVGGVVGDTATEILARFRRRGVRT